MHSFTENESENEAILFLKNRFPEKNIELVTESETRFEFLVNAVTVILTDLEIDQFIDRFEVEEVVHQITMIQKGAEIFYIAEIGRQADYMKFNNNEVNTKLSNRSIKLFDISFKLIPLSELNANKKNSSGTLISSCASSDLQHCIVANCIDAGNLLCGACILSKWCFGVFVVGCIIEVETGFERDIYCESTATNDIELD